MTYTAEHAKRRAGLHRPQRADTSSMDTSPEKAEGIERLWIQALAGWRFDGTFDDDFHRYESA